MKKFNIFFAILIMFTLMLAACGGNDNTDETEDTESEATEATETTESTYEPESIDPETDVCEVCGMAIADDEHATQIILKNDRSLKFDDIGDMFVWIEENSEDDIGAKFVRDFHSREWIELEDATFVYDEEISTPMGFGVISFKDGEEAEAYVEENSFGEILSAADLYDHEWEMMMDHGHEGHDHGHGEHDHGHGFHTEGFDMHFTELENVSVAEETELEVNMTLDDIALEEASVRYEIWKEDDKDNTDWVDANEDNPGSYVANYTFNEPGTYHIQVHVENDDLHEHVEYEVSVKE